MNILKSINEEWKLKGVVPHTIKKGTIIYTGQKFKEKIGSGHLKNEYGIWYSQNVKEALDYCYFCAKNYKKYFFKATVIKDVTVLKFPASYHPAHALYEADTKSLNSAQNTLPKLKKGIKIPAGLKPDQYLNSKWKSLIKLYSVNTVLSGHVRYKKCAPGTIDELWIDEPISSLNLRIVDYIEILNEKAKYDKLEELDDEALFGET